MPAKKKQETASTTKSTEMKPLIIGAVVALIAVAGLVFVVMGNGSGKGGSQQAANQVANIAPAAANAQATQESAIKLGNPTVAIVNGEAIKRSEVLTYIANLPERVRQTPLQNLFPLAVDQVVLNKIVAMRANKASLENDEQVEALVENAKKQAIRTVYLEREVTSQVTQKKLLNAYEELLDRVEGVQEMRARHILVETEDEAKALIKQLDDGADFEQLAKENSTGPSAVRGGDLGYFAKADMVPEFANAAFDLKSGTHSKKPVQTQFGWHVIKAEDLRDRQVPPFEQVKPQLEVQLRQQALADLMQSWQKEAKVEKYDINGEEVKQN